MDKTEIAKIIREGRKKKNWGFRKLGHETGVDKNTIASLEAGKTDPRLSTVIDILHALGYKLVIKEI